MGMFSRYASYFGHLNTTTPHRSDGAVTSHGHKAFVFQVLSRSQRDLVAPLVMRIELDGDISLVMGFLQAGEERWDINRPFAELNVAMGPAGSYVLELNMVDV
jgi:hypothetical protein